MENKTNFATFIRESAWISLGSIVALVGSFIFWVIAGLLSDSTQVGYATTAFSIAALSWGLLNFGLDTAALREVPVFKKKAYSALLSIALSLGLVAAGLTFIFSTTYQSFYTFIILASIMALVGPMSLVSVHSLIGLQNAKMYFLMNIIGFSSRIVLMVPFLAHGFAGLGITAAVTASLVIVALFSTIIVAKKLGLEKPASGSLRSLLGLGMSNYPAALTALFVSGGTVFLSILTRNPAQVGSFYIAMMISIAAGALGYGIAMAILPALTRENSIRLKDEALRLGLALTIPLAIPLLIYPNNVLALLGPSYALGVSPLFILSWIVIPYTAYSIVLKRANAENLLKKIASASLSQLLILLLLMVLLIPRMGTDGAAYAYSISIVVGLLMLARMNELLSLIKIFAIFVMVYLISLILVAIQIEWIVSLAVLEAITLVSLLTTRSLKMSDGKIFFMKR